MKNSTTQAPDTASQRREIRRIDIRNPLRIVLAGVLLLAASTAVAGVIFVPVENIYPHPELAPVRVSFNDPTVVTPTYIPPVENGLLQLDTTGLGGAFRVAADDLPPGFEIPAGISAGLPFEQQLQLVINLSLGVVEGRSRGRIPLNNQTLEFQTDVRGNATCLPRNGRECGQLVVVLELRGALSDPYDPTRVGLIETTLLGSLVRDDAGIARWVTLSGNTMLGGNEALISSVLEYAACKGGLAIC